MILWNKSFPTIVAIVGRIKPPQMVRVNETGSEFDVYATAGVRGKYSLFPIAIGVKFKFKCSSFQNETLYETYHRD